MATDARFEKIQKIVPHSNADSLEIATVSNFPCVVRKGEFKEGDIVFYVRDDAKLSEYDGYREFMSRYENPDSMFPQDSWHPERFSWQEGLMKYLGGGGRVKTVKLRGQVSMGILVKPEELGLGTGLTETGMDEINRKISDTETGHGFLLEKFGVDHWVPPTTSFGDLNVLHQGLEFGLDKTDEENWENLPGEDLHLGANCIVTKKLDGTSCTVICEPDGHYSVASRSMTFNVEEMSKTGRENIYTQFTKEAVKAGLRFASETGWTIALRGEVCCRAVQNMNVNKDKDLNGFYLFRTEFPEVPDRYGMKGTYGSQFHFLEIAKKFKEWGFDVRTVPVLEKDVPITKDLLEKYNDMPASFGEGVVINVDFRGQGGSLSNVWSYKSKSREYLIKVG